MVMAVTLVSFFLLVGVMGFMLQEGWTFLDAIYFCSVTITTVG